MDPAIFLIADHREHAVLKHAKEFENVNLKVKQITVGDYVLCCNWNVVCVIERKSLEDYAASIKDGRADNKEKMLKLREETGCTVMYIIEGPEFPKPNDMYGGIPWKYIESSIFHLQVRDGIGIMRSSSTLDTANLLARFTNSMVNLQKKYVFPAKSNVETILGAAPETACVPTLTNPECALMGRLQQREEKPMHDIVRAMWSTLPGIATETADSFIVYPIVDMCNGMIDVSKLTVHGRKISKKVQTSLTNMSQYGAKILACIPGISKATAILVLQGGTFTDVLTMTSEELACVMVSNRKLGVRGEKIYAALRYKYPG
jgi:ERCC4-type nuclease